MDIALDHLTEAEQDAIYAVLHRDDELRTKEHERIRQLQNDVKKIKLAGVIKPGIDADKTCARCRKEFGWIFNKGQICPSCQHKVCENCKANLKIGGWICILCQKQREIEAMSGQWFYKKFRKSKRNRKTNQIISGNEIIRASIRKKPSPPRYGRMRNSAEFEARNAGRRVGSPSSLILGSDGGGEDSDTQSTEMGPTSRNRRQDVAFPKTSDQARLQNLITGGGTVAANPPPTRRVISVSGMGHDSSSSESEPSSPVLPKSNKHVFTHDDSILSSDRASPVSAISSEGHMTMVTERDISDIESLRSAVSGMEDFDSKRDSARAETAAAPPRRIAKTLEQERLEALEEKSQEDLTGYSDSGDSDVASLTDLVTANQDDNDLEFTAVYELNSSLNGPSNHTKETASKETVSKETASKETDSKETASKETASKETAPKETAYETLHARAPQIKSSTIHTQQMVPSETPQIESSTIQTQQMVHPETDNKLDESPSSVMAAVKTWESRKTPDRSYLGNEIDWSQVEEIDMVEEDDESDLTASDGGFSASALLDVPGAEERTMKRAGGVVISNDSGAKIFRSSESSTGSEFVTDKSNVAPDDHEMQDTHVYVNGMITPTNSASSSDSTQTPSRSETAAAQHEALKELRANISVALQRLSNSPHDEEFQFEKSSHSSHEEEEHDYRKLNVSPQNEENLSVVVHRENVMRSMNRNTIDELADGYENFQVPAPSSVKLREQMLRNANRNTLDFLAEENEMEHEKEIDLDDIIEENTHDMVFATENIPSKVDTWNNFATVQAKTSQFDSDSETDKESDEDQNMTVVEAKEIALALPITFNSFDWERLDQQGLKTDVAEEDPESEDEIHPDTSSVTEITEEHPNTSSVTEITEEITYEETTVMKRQPSDPSDTMRGSRHRKMYVIDTDHKIVVPGLNSDDESDSLNEQSSSSNRSSTVTSGENEPPVIEKEDCDINLTNDTDTAIANVDDTANMPPAINSAIKQKAPQPNFLQLVQSRLGFGPDYDTTKKSVSFNPYTEEYSDHSTEKSPDISFVTETVSEVATIHVVSNKLEDNPVASSGSEESDSGDEKDQPVVVVVSNLETNAMPEAKEITRDSRSGSSNSEQSLENDKMDDPSDQEGQFELRAKSDSQISTKSSSDSSREEVSLELHETADTDSETDSESDFGSPLKVEDLNSQKRVLVRQDMYVESDSDVHDLSKSDSRESKEEEPSTDATTTFDDVYESVSLGPVDVVPGLAVVNKNIHEEQRSHNGPELRDGEDSDDGLADSMAASMVAQTLRDVGWDESSDGLVRDAVCDSPVASVGDDISANSDRARSDSSLNEGDLSMSSSELINPAPPTTSPSSSMAPEDKVGNDSANEANGGVVPAIIVSEVNKDGSVGRRSKTSAMSEESSLVEPRFDDEEEEDIDELFSSAAVNRSTTNLSSTYSESRESIASYYSDAGEGSKYPVTGDIEFGAHYNYTTGILEVNVKKCRNIAAVDAKKKRSDPYVKAYLLPDKNRAGKRKTKIKKHTVNPVFDEILRFSITKSELESRTLSLSVWHNDKFGRNDFLGEVVVPIDAVNIDDLKPDWYPLLDRLLPLTPTSVVTYKGDLLISLQYEQTDPSKPGSLHVRVKEARNLTPKDNGTSDPFCKGYLLPDKTSKQSKQKTAVKKKTVNPKWDQTLIFSGVSLSDLTQRSLELTVWDHDRFNRNDFLGGVRLNLATGHSEGQEVDWMDARGEEVSLWQSMIHRPNVWIDGNLMLRPSMDQRN